MLGRNTLFDRYPWLGPSAVGAAYCASDGQANPRLVGPAFARAARAAGATLIEHDGAQHVERDGSGFVVETESGRTLRGNFLINSSAPGVAGLQQSSASRSRFGRWSRRWSSPSPRPILWSPCSP